MRKYNLNDFDLSFTRNWFFNRNYATFVKFVKPRWEGEPITYLEIGVFEGQSLCWCLKHILTHPDSRAVGIDPHLMTRKLSSERMEAVMARASHNLKPWPKCELIRGNSSEVLRRMTHRRGWGGIKRGFVDLCMVDGDHHSFAVLDDAKLCLRLLRPGGWMLFDDWKNGRKKEDHVKEGIEMFLDRKGSQVRVEWEHKYMICFSKIGSKNG